MKSKNRGEQRFVSETLSDLLMGNYYHYNDETQKAIDIGLRILQDVEIENEDGVSE